MTWQCDLITMKLFKPTHRCCSQSLATPVGQTAVNVCPKCGSFWEESQRFARMIGLEEAQLNFLEYFRRRVKWN
jgi:hypothetical protein